MFTGLIESVCRVRSAAKVGGGMRLEIGLAELAGHAKHGDSIAVNGVCLTAADLKGSVVDFDVSGETLLRTTIGDLTTSSLVNVELALKPADRLAAILFRVISTARRRFGR